MKRWWHILIAGLVLVGLFVYLNNDVKQELKKKETDEKEALLFSPDYKWNDVAEMAISTSMVEVAFVPQYDPKFTGGPETWNWTIVRPFPTDAEVSDVQNYIRTLKELKIKSVISDTAADLASYGLDTVKAKPLRFKFTDKVGKATELLIGSPNYDRSGNYAMFTDAKKVLLIENRLNYLQDKELTQFRRKALVDYDNQEVAKISYKWGQSPAIVVERHDGAWQLSAPFSAPGDKAKINGYLADIKNVRVEKFPTELGDKQAVQYGFQSPRGTIELTMEPHGEEKQGKSLKLFVGASNKEKSGFYMKRADASTVYEIQNFHFEKLQKTLDYFIEHALSDYDPTSINNAVVLGADGKEHQRLELLDNGTWKLFQSGITSAAAYDKTQLLIRKLREMMAKQFVSKRPEKGQGFDKPELQIVLKGPAGETDKQLPTYRYIFSSVKPGKKGEAAKVYVQAGKDNFVHEIEPAYYQIIRDTVEKLRDPHLLTNLLAYDGLEMRRGAEGKAQIVATKHGEVWKIDKESWGILPPGSKPEAIVDALASLEAARYLIGVTGGKELGWQPDKNSDFTVTLRSAAGKLPEQSFQLGIIPVLGGKGYFASVKASGSFDAYEAMVGTGMERLLQLLGLRKME